MDVDSTGELVAAQLLQVLVMRDAGDGSRVGSGPGEPLRGNPCISAGVRSLTMPAWACVVLDDHLGG